MCPKIKCVSCGTPTEKCKIVNGKCPKCSR